MGTVIRCIWIIIVPLLTAACATPRNAVANNPAQSPPLAADAVSPTKVVETCYYVRGYHETANPAIRHEAHAVYRSTRVSIRAEVKLATVPRNTYPMATYSPLPASVELATELAAQKAITEDLRAMQTSMADTGRRLQTQYATLVQESAEVAKVHEQLEADRARIHAAPPAGTAPAPGGLPPGSSSEVKW